MLWIAIIVEKMVDWLLEIPADLLGRQIERSMDGLAERRGSARGRRRRKVTKRKVHKRDRRPARPSPS